MRFTIIHLACLAGLACVACVAPHAARTLPAASTATQNSSSPAVEGVLYARDGTPVMGGTKGAARVDAEPKRDLGESEGGRASLLELYTKAVADKNALAEEVVALTATLEAERKAATDGAEEREVLRGELTKLTRERDTLKAEAFDLAARLTTAQIARLEVQKTLLELQIDARMRAEAAASVQTTSKDKKRNGGDHK